MGNSTPEGVEMLGGQERVCFSVDGKGLRAEFIQKQEFLTTRTCTLLKFHNAKNCLS